MDFVIIGAGRLGTSLGAALVSRGHVLKGLTCRKIASARQSRNIIGQGRVLQNNSQAVSLAETLFLCLPDEKIPAVVNSLARARVDWSRKTVFHTSGLLPAAILGPLQKKGAAIASFHPVQSFCSKKTPASHFQGIYVGLEGDGRACRLGSTLARELGAYPFRVPAQGKPAYHAACTISSGLLLALLDSAFRLLHKAGIKESEARLLLFPLVEGTLRNVKNLDTLAALTGPLVRGDIPTLKSHLQTLSSQPELKAAYRALSRLVIRRTRGKGLTRPKIKALKNLLGGR